MGNGVKLYDCKLDYDHGFLISIGDDVTITGATILVYDASTKRELGFSKGGRVVIGSHVFIGVGSIILPNVCTGDKDIMWELLQQKIYRAIQLLFGFLLEALTLMRIITRK